MADANPFRPLLEKLPDPATRECLSVVNNARGLTLREVERKVQAGPMEPHLQHLLSLGLVASDGQHWTVTWVGRGVYHWHQQLSWAEFSPEEAMPEPRAGENGDDLVPGCNQYRPVFASAGRCWCGKTRRDHASEAPKTAAKMLAQEREEIRREALWRSCAAFRLCVPFF